MEVVRAAGVRNQVRHLGVSDDLRLLVELELAGSDVGACGGGEPSPAGSGGGDNVWPVMSNLDISVSSGSTFFMPRLKSGRATRTI